MDKIANNNQRWSEQVGAHDNNEITSTAEMAEQEWDGGSEPEDVRSDMVATKEAEYRGIEFHVSMRDYTLRDMEELIVEAAARTLVGRHNDRELAKKIEAKCVELISDKADKALASVTSEIIDQPLTPQYAHLGKDAKPVTMRELLGLYGREYLTASVGTDGKPAGSGGYGYHNKPRIQYLVEHFLDVKFKREIEQATNAAIREIQAGVAARHNEMLEAEKARIREALAKVTGA